MSATELGQPFADAVDLYRERGWSSPIPLGNPGERACKAPVPKKTTGHDARVPTDRVIESWKRSHADNNIGLHLADALGVIGLDVDDYTTPSGKVKSGGKTLAELEAELGPLPPTFKVTSRGPGVSGIMVFRVPPGFEYVTKLPGIDVIQAKHRYMAVWPSVHPDTGEIYYWYSLDGRKLKRPPAIEDVPELPKAWLEYLLSAAARGLDKSAEASDDDVRAWLRAHAGSVCRAVRNVCATEVAELSEADAGSRYDAMVAGVMALVRLGTEGHTGVKSALATLRTEYAEAVGTDREPEAIGGEWRRSVIGAVAAVMDAEEAPTHGRKCPDREPERDPDAPEPWPSPRYWGEVAQRVVDEHWSVQGYPSIANWREDYYTWRATCWKPRPTPSVRRQIWRALANAYYADASGDLVPFAPNRAKVAEALDALGSIVEREYEDEPDSHIGDVALIPCANAVLRLNRVTGERELSEHSPELFNTYSLPFDYDESLPEPKHLLRFLESLQVEDEAVDILQEWTGAVVAGDVSKHKILYLFGDTRTGKGVYTRMLQKLVGNENTASPNLAQLGSEFGLQPTIGKRLITVNDARFRGVDQAKIIERLLNFTGDDKMQINRKNREQWEGYPITHVMIVSNDQPSFTGEHSTALPKRLLPVRLHRSFFGIEDESLERKLAGELGSILLWALEGYDRLCEQGHFTVSKTSDRIRNEIEEAVSPVLTFLDERCRIDPDGRAPKDRLYAAYRSWASESGIYVASKIEFGRQLQGALGDRVRATKMRPRRVAEGDEGGQIHAWRGLRLLERSIGL